MALAPIVEDLWCATLDHTFMGMHLGTRMTVIRLPGAKLWLHSAIAIDDSLRAEVDALGEVAHIVAPNLYHHCYAEGWKKAYPAALLWGAPGLSNKRKDLPFDGTLDDAPDPAWADVIDQTPLRGCMLGEIVFFHRPTRTLVTSDLLENFESSPHFGTRLYLKAAGIHGKPGVSRMLRPIYRDREAARASLERMLAWEFERIVLAHGNPIERDAMETLRAAYTWL
jgi:hypothetical protein